MTRTVLISGAGIAGPTLAYWLVQHGFSPTIVERSPAPRTGGYMIDFWGVGYDVAERMGLLPTLHRVGYQLDEVRIVNDAGRRIAGLDATLFYEGSNGRFVSLLRGDLATSIFGLLHDGVETMFADSITALTQDSSGVSVTFERAPARRFDLVVGADGLHSTVRELAFGKHPEYEKDLGYRTAAFSAAAYPHRDEGAYVSFTAPGCQVARYALRDGRSVFFIVIADDRPMAMDHHDLPAQQAYLRDRLAGAGWECDQILDAMDRSDDFYFDTVAQIRMPDWSHGRVVLLGDAAYCPSLLAGQGSAFAMTGAYVLANQLARTNGEHIAAFAGYQQSLRPFIEDKQRTAVRFGWWFAPTTALGVRLRNVATNAMGLPLLGRAIARRSFGDRFQLPD